MNERIEQALQIMADEYPNVLYSIDKLNNTALKNIIAVILAENTDSPALSVVNEHHITRAFYWSALDEIYWGDQELQEYYPVEHHNDLSRACGMLAGREEYE